MKYEEFIENKRHRYADHGIDCAWMPDGMFDFQKYVTGYAIKKGRCAVFLDTGLGKTIIELTVATNYIRHTNKPTLIITPLAVAFQFLREADKFHIGDISYSRNGSYGTKIVVCNYEQLEHFEPDDFSCVILDESSILKNFDGARRKLITNFLRKVQYRFLFTATPSPNDFVELGTSAEALGYMGYTDMLSRFFTNNEDTISSMNIGTQWLLKGHARNSFFEWVSGWSISMRRPSDLGYDDDLFVLPDLRVRYTEVHNESPLEINGQPRLFNSIARTRAEIQAEQRNTIVARCNKAVEIGSKNDVCVYWTNYNDEAHLIETIDSKAVQISGTMPIEQKEEILSSFADGSITHLVTKAKITAFGLNWQHCNNTVIFPTFSYEQYYQAIRRFWRFGQTKDVTVDIIYSDGMQRVLDSLVAKSDKANELFSKLNANLHKSFDINQQSFPTITNPVFI